ncbi:MAG TPA: amino acid permease [Anaerolineaceae bacterium]
MADNKPKTREEIIQQDVHDLHKMGYAQQLFREMGGFSNFAVSFSIISILTGAMLLYGYGLKFAGPVINTVGWPVISLFVMCIAASMAEIASAYPTAGGLYYWAFRLGNKKWAWTGAWLNMVGQITITAGIDIAAAIYIVGLLSRGFGVDPNLAIPVFGSLTNWFFYVFVMILLMIPQVLFNIFGIKLTTKLTDFSVWWHIGGVLIMALLLTLFAKTHNSLAFVFSGVNTVNPLDAASATFADGTTGPALVIGSLTLHSPLFAIVPGLVNLYKVAPFGFVFILAFLQAQWTYTGFDASANVAEETVMARLNSAWGVFLSVAISAIVGYIVLMALTFAIPDIAATVNDPYPVLYIAYSNLSLFMANLIGIIVFGGMWLCGLASITNMSRMWFAFARDGGMPGSDVIKKVDPKWRTPINAILITTFLAILLTVYSAAYSVITSISTITLYIAYNLPVYLNLRNKLQKKGEFTTAENAPWNLKQWGVPLNFIAVAYTVFITILFCLPPNELVLWTMLAISLLLFIYWQVYAKNHFKGPQEVSEADLQRIEQQMAEAGHHAEQGAEI